MGVGGGDQERATRTHVFTMLAVPSYGYDGFLWELKHSKNNPCSQAKFFFGNFRADAGGRRYHLI